MTRVRLDNILLTSLVDCYINYKTDDVNITISGSVASLATMTFTGSIPYQYSNTRADIYITNLGTGQRMLFSNGARILPFTYTGAEIATKKAEYDGANLNFTVAVTNNTGGPIVLTTQTLKMSAVFYKVPT